MIVVSHPTGNEFVRAWLKYLFKAGQLSRFVTSVSAGNMAWLLKRLPEACTRQIFRRNFEISGTLIETRPLRESVRLAARQLKLEGLTRHESGWACVDAVYRDVDEFAASRIGRIEGARAAYCYEDAAELTFKAAAASGMKCVYDLPIAYWELGRRLMLEEAGRLPAWEPTLQSTRDSQAKLERKTRELLAADMVVCPSQFVMESIPTAVREAKPCIVAKFGSPEAIPGPHHEKHEKLRVLFAGSLSQRKGLADLFAAFKLLKRSDLELVLFGAAIAPMDFYRSQYGNFKYEPPRPHSEVLALMQSCDVLVLPSILEGRALVQQEAMACGLPLIVTSNAGGEDLVLEGETGFLVPIRSPELIAARLDWMADHREQARQMGQQAQMHAHKLTWQSYAETIFAAITKAMST